MHARCAERCAALWAKSRTRTPGKIARAKKKGSLNLSVPIGPQVVPVLWSIFRILEGNPKKGLLVLRFLWVALLGVDCEEHGGVQVSHTADGHNPA